MKHYIAIYDTENEYDKKLEEYINSKENFPFMAKVFNSSDLLEKQMKDYKPDIILSDEEMPIMEEEIPVIYLSKNKMRCLDGKIYKYQKIDRILKIILDQISDKRIAENVINRKTSLKLIMFYTPIRMTYSTSFAIAMGQEISKSSKALYVNMEYISGMEQIIDDYKERDLIDLMYVLEGHKDNIATQIYKMIYRKAGLDMMPVIKSPSDLYDIRFEQWRKLIDAVEHYTDYEYLLIDLSDCVNGLYEMLKLADIIITTIDDKENNRKLISYEHYLNSRGMKEISDKTYRIRIPYFENISIEKDGCCDEYGVFVREELTRILNNEHGRRGY